MSILKRIVKSFQVLLQELLLLPLRLNRWLSRQFLRSPRNASQAGFILPTVVMVILVVTLLTTTIVFRSFDRAKNASNVRVNQVVLNAALPAIERAKKKIDAVFADPTLPQGTPADTALLNAFNDSQYDLGDEVRLRLAADISGNNAIETRYDNANASVSPTRDEVMTTAWRFPVDTDNNGKFDSFTLYGIYFRSPSSGDDRPRSEIEARTPPQDDSATSQACAVALGTSASLTGSDGWYKVGGKLKKGFYVYTLTVPIVEVTGNILPSGGDYSAANLYEVYAGNRGFSAIEYQQDRSRIPLGNNAVVYEDDLEIFTGSTQLNLNGRIIANSNFHSGRGSGPVGLYQVSSDESCFYETENGKIFVGGNVSNGVVGSTASQNDINVDLYTEGADPGSQKINNTEKSTNQNASLVAYNTQAYEERIAFLVQAAIAQVGTPPEAVTKEVDNRLAEPGNTKTQAELLEEEYQTWFRERTRRVPFSEVPFGDSGIGNKTVGNVLTANNTDFLRPIDEWHYPVNQNNGKTSTIPGLALKSNKLDATNPDELGASELQIGDRVLVGNNLPEKWFDPTTGSFATEESQQLINGENWTGTNVQRYRQTRISALADLGDISRDGFWEKAAAKLPENTLDGYGGLRVVTGAGIYLPLDINLGQITNLDLNNPINNTVSRVIWPDTMPVIPYTANHTTYSTTATNPDWLRNAEDTNSNSNPDFLDDESGDPRPFLRMRATAVYHYTKDDDGSEDTPAPPIACISSFYDPTDSTTAQNRSGLTSISGDLAWENPPNLTRTLVTGSTPNSNNGITYSPPQSIDTGLANNNILRYQAELVYPNGRLVNPQLAQALIKLAGGGISNLSNSDRAAIDSALCALQILASDGVSVPGFGAISPSTSLPGGYTIPHGTIQEVAFLDGREIKAIEGNANTCGFTRGDSCLDSSGTNPSQDNSYDRQPSTTGRSADTTNFDNNVKYRISQYDLAIEMRQPLEVRATAIDLDILRRQTTPASTNGPDPEYLFPDSGVIYASRDDALPDASDRPADPQQAGYTTLYNQELDKFEKVSATDFWLDPTRRPNGIMLINGSSLGRNNNNDFREEEKGLIFVSNNPLYIRAGDPGDGTPGFNLHTGGSGEEFDEKRSTDWGNFYTRSAGTNGSGFNDNFACRTNDDRLPPDKCLTGDLWRQATILSDTITLLTHDFRFGFRSDGDFDLRNNQTDNLFRNITTSTLTPDPANTNILVKSSQDIDKARRENGFWDNTFVTNGLSSNNATAFGTSTGYTDFNYAEPNQTALGSSYFNNGVLPIQRRKDAPEYVMEICRKLPVSECTPKDWVVGYNFISNSLLTDNFSEEQLKVFVVPHLRSPFTASNITVDINGDGVFDDPTLNLIESEITAEELLRIKEALDKTTGSPWNEMAANRLGAGTTVEPPFQTQDQHYPRRVAFKRNYGNMVLTSFNNQLQPIPLGMNSSNTVQTFPYDGSINPANGTKVPRTTNNSLWFRGSNDNEGQLWSSHDYTSTNRWLSYEQPFAEPSGTAAQQRTAYIAGYQGEQDDWLLPDFATSARNLTIPAVLNVKNRFNGSVPSSPINNSDFPTDYAVCIQGSAGNGATSPPANLVSINAISGTCPSGVGTAINTTVSDLRSVPFPAPPGNNPPLAITGTPSIPSGVNRITTGSLALPRLTDSPSSINSSVYVYHFSTTSSSPTAPTYIAENPNPTVVNPTPFTTFNYLGSNDPLNPAQITLKGDQDTIFIFEPQGGPPLPVNNLPHPLLFQNVRLILDGVNPNNIFWVSEAGMIFSGENRLAGNFVALNTAPLLFDFVDQNIPQKQTEYQIPYFVDTGITQRLDYTFVASAFPFTEPQINADPLSTGKPFQTIIDGGRFLGFNGSGLIDTTVSPSVVLYNEFNTVARSELNIEDQELIFNAITTSHQPLLVPVLQLSIPKETNRTPINYNVNTRRNHLVASNWLQKARDTNANAEDGTFNFVMATGDSPSRYRSGNPLVLESNGSFGNLTRLLENWYDQKPITILGSFIQLKRSTYATAPYWQLLHDNAGFEIANNSGSFFGYPQIYSLNVKRNNIYEAPTRNWGFDVGILSQLPDLFSQRFTLPPTDDPNEYYREVSRDDDWIQNLLCGTFSNTNGQKIGGKQPVNTNYRPSSCPENP
ncbi:hormogonium polysaccharide biosynthesis protein HpsA [Spirulina sp. 06S082]|uniref:hormogonium polysaccharide biosynthesis protein HpsA n=1 Tax=Spirulina sp. 06S082 TaxID=3110248 RepID=UPI002B1F5C21|nr:hormogonium polysaccharide biosynthesis protein HpsA [Spirulina sp. 06S082]MEA5468767.1 hormogonium polysaccharide biosynthesis protein HpsA [Spirulina sp. 06S082]